LAPHANKARLMTGTSPSIDAAEPSDDVRDVTHLRSYIEEATSFAIFDPAAIRPLRVRCGMPRISFHM
jgi:hypothetical protein